MFLLWVEVVEVFDCEAEFAGEGSVDGFVAGEVAEAFEDELPRGLLDGWGAEGLDGSECFEGGLEGGAGGEGEDLPQGELVGAAEFELGEAGFVPVVEECVGGLVDFFWGEVCEWVLCGLHAAKVSVWGWGSRGCRGIVVVFRARVGDTR
ncbi:MAG: hypothetical protein JJU33_07820 [Phycisphaerales bacterium]|nr:hypothetical protein [Phycisphaerales bacterium]